jgi:hypothetical protein
LDPFLEPGVLVRHPDGRLGARAGAVGRRTSVTVNFEHAGKQVIDAAVVTLTYVGDDPRA